MNDNVDKVAAYHLFEFVKDVVRLNGDLGIFHYNVPGGLPIAKRAIEEKLVQEKSHNKEFSVYLLTTDGLFYAWEFEDDLKSHKVIDTIICDES